MHRLKISLILIITTLLITACEDNRLNSISEINTKAIVTVENNDTSIEKNITSHNESKNKNMIQIPINIISKDKDKNKNEIQILEIEENLTLEEKLKKIVNAISSECFNNLPMEVEVYPHQNTAIVELIEPKDSTKNRVSWEKDYLGENIKKETINTIVTNLIQEEYKGEWIDKVKLYYNDEIIQLD